jgi:hypothetical protein
MFAERIGLEHEGLHRPTGHPDYNESTYYNVVDHASGLIGWVRMAVQANQHAGQTSALFFLSDEALFGHVRYTVEAVDTLELGRLRIAVEQPHRRQRVRFEGDLHAFADPRDLANPATAFARAPRRLVRLDLEFDANGEPFGASGDDAENVLDSSMALGHYQQFATVTGTVRVDGHDTAIRGGGLRDHSWGPRDWAGPLFYRWVTVSFTDGSGVMVLQNQPRAGGLIAVAATMREDRSREAHWRDLRWHWTDDGFCSGMSVRVADEDSEFTLRSTVRTPARYVPLRYRRANTAVRATDMRMGYCAYDFETDDGRRGAGIIETLDEIVHGRPVGVAVDEAPMPPVSG